MFDASYTVDVISKFSQAPTERSSATDKLQCTVCIFKKVPRMSINFVSNNQISTVKNISEASSVSPSSSEALHGSEERLTLTFPPKQHHRFFRHQTFHLCKELIITNYIHIGAGMALW